MSVDLRGRSFLKLLDFTPSELNHLLDLAARLKTEKLSGAETPRLTRRNIGLIFEKGSTRTRCSFEVAILDQGGHSVYLGPTGTQIGTKESMKDTARVLGRMFDGIEYRGFSQSRIEDLAAHAGVPVWNGLTDEWHPTQILADALTMREHSDVPLEEVAYCYLGDARFNMGNSLLAGGALLGMDVRIAAPRALWPAPELIERCSAVADQTGARVTVTDNVDEGVAGADFLHTDVWVSMGEPDSVWAERIEMLAPYKIDAAAMERTGKPSAKFMHCLPAFHNRDTEVGEAVYRKFGLDGIEVTEEVFESDSSIVFDQAANRLHTIKAVLVATMTGE